MRGEEYAKKALSYIYFFPLVVCENLYVLFFTLVQYLRRKFFQRRLNEVVISVGNLTVGGSGKTVFVDYCAQVLQPLYRGAILLRGYKRPSGKSYELVRDFHHILASCSQSGDEAFEHALSHKGPVCVGKNRYQAAFFVKKRCGRQDFFLLDDGYQHPFLFHDLSILLLDAVYPFDNGHCLPRGRLREKDYSRAHVLVFTNSLKISLEQKKMLFAQFKTAENEIFFGDVIPVGFCDGKKKYALNFFDNKAVFVVAGIARPERFFTTLETCKIKILSFLLYPDHYWYTAADVKTIDCQAYKASAVITTRKDWVKLCAFKSTKKRYYLEVRWQFDSDLEQKSFEKLLLRAVREKGKREQ